METDRALVDSPSFSKERLLRILGVTFGVAVGIGGAVIIPSNGRGVASVCTSRAKAQPPAGERELKLPFYTS
jgi:hypothetical protein